MMEEVSDFGTSRTTASLKRARVWETRLVACADD